MNEPKGGWVRHRLPHHLSPGGLVPKRSQGLGAGKEEGGTFFMCWWEERTHHLSWCARG